jgi:RNA polymerase sigma-70 factor (ECF subfamily)
LDARRDTADEALMSAYAAGDARAFDVLYARHRVWLYGLLVRQLDDRARADDVFQETWYSLVRSAPRYQPSARFTTWLYLLARQRLVDHWRRLDPEPEPLAFNEDEDAQVPGLLEALADTERDPARAAERSELAAHLARALAALPALQREAFLLAEHADMSLDEIAAATGSAREAVKSRLRYARRRLAESLARDWKERNPR